jgi:hypothetical protein
MLHCLLLTARSQQVLLRFIPCLLLASENMVCIRTLSVRCPNTCLAARSKIVREVMEKERTAFEGRRAAGGFKLMERSKVEANMKEFVRLSVKKHYSMAAGVAGGTAPVVP